MSYRTVIGTAKYNNFIDKTLNAAQRDDVVNKLGHANKYKLNGFVALVFCIVYQNSSSTDYGVILIFLVFLNCNCIVFLI